LYCRIHFPSFILFLKYINAYSRVISKQLDQCSFTCTSRDLNYQTTFFNDTDLRQYYNTSYKLHCTTFRRFCQSIPTKRLYKQREWSFRDDWIAARVRQSWPTTLLDSNRFEGRKDKRVKWRANIRIVVPICLHTWNGRCAYTYIRHIAEGSGRRVNVCTLTRTSGVCSWLGTPPRCPTHPVIPMVRSSRWSCLIRLQARWSRIDIFAWVFQAIGREIARSRHILYAYANRPRLSPSLSIRLSVRLPRVQPVLPCLVFLPCVRCNTTCTNKTTLFNPLSLSCCRLFDLYDPYQYLVQWKPKCSCYCVL